MLRIARKVATDRVISTVDPQARHGHKTSHRGFDGYKAHIAVGPDSEIITATSVTAGNTGDAPPAADLITDLTDPPADTPGTAPPGKPAVYGDVAYGVGEVLQRLHDAGIDIKTKVQPPVAPAGKFIKDRFVIDLAAATVTCPNQVTIAIRPIAGHDRHAGQADFGKACTGCPATPATHRLETGRHISGIASRSGPSGRKATPTVFWRAQRPRPRRPPSRSLE